MLQWQVTPAYASGFSFINSFLLYSWRILQFSRMLCKILITVKDEVYEHINQITEMLTVDICVNGWLQAQLDITYTIGWILTYHRIVKIYCYHFRFYSDITFILLIYLLIYLFLFIYCFEKWQFKQQPLIYQNCRTA